MACFVYDRLKHYLHTENVLRKTLSQYRGVERIPVTELVSKFVDSIKALDLFNLDTVDEIISLTSSFGDIVKTVKMLNDSQKKTILQSYENEMNKRFNINPVESTTAETNVELEIKDLPENVNNDEENSEDRVLDYSLDTLYGDAVVLKEFMLNEYRKHIVNAALVNFEEGRIVRTAYDLNHYIANYKNKLFKQLVDYIKYDHSINDIKFDPNIIDYIYDIAGEPNTVNMDKVLKMATDIFYDMDKSRLSNAFISRHLIYKGELRNRQTIDAFNAFLLLSPGNFDKVLSSLMGDSFKIKEVYKGEVSVKLNKYLFEKTNSLRKGWGGSENVDAIKELGSISKLLIEQTPLLSAQTGKPISDNNLTLKQFLYAMNKLRDEQTFQKFEKNSKMKEYVIKFHDRPRHYLGLILDYLITNNEAVRYFSASDMNVYYSIYERYFNKGRKDSLYNIMNNEYKEYAIASTQYDLLESIAGVVDRTNPAKYVQYAVNQDLGDMDVNEISQSNSLRLRLQREHDMEITNKLRTDRAKIVNDYNIQLANATTGDISFDIRVKGNLYSFITNKEGKVGHKLSVLRNGTSMSINNIIKEPDFDAVKNFYERMGTDVDIDSEGNQVYLEIIKLSDTLLNTGFLRGNVDLLAAFKDIHEQKDSINYLTESLMSMVSSAALANYIYNEFETNNTEYADLGEFMQTFNFFNNMDAKVFEKYYDVASESIKIINENLEPLEKLASANQLINGEVFKSVTKNANGDNVPNSRISNLAGLTRYWLETSIRENPNSPLNSSLFASNPEALMGINIKTDAISRNGVRKSASAFTEAEHAYSSIVYDFYANLVHNSSKTKLAQHVYTQPAVLADKSTLIMWKTKMEGYLHKGKNVNLSTATPEILNELIQSTVGGYYRGTLDSVVNDYRKVYNDSVIQTYIDRLKDFAAQDQVRLSKTVDDKAQHTLAKRIASLNSAYERINKKLLTLPTENTKILKKNAAIQAKIDEIQRNNAEAEMMGDMMGIINEAPELIPLKTASDLLEIIDFQDLMSVTTIEEFGDIAYANGARNIENVHSNKGYTGKYTVDGGIESKMEFVQPNTLLMYNAIKLYNEKNSTIFNKQILREKKKFIRDLVNNNVSFPLIYSDGKPNTMLEQIIKEFIPKDRDKWINSYTQELILAKVGDRNITRLSPLDDVRDDSQIELNPLLERYFLVDFLLSENLRLITTGSELAHPDKSKSTHDLSMGMVELEEASRAGAQNKRNVSIPGTLQYYQQDSFLGIPPKVRIAIMPDIGAHVYNYSGSDDKVDAHDGSAFNNPINSLLENYSLQDSSVGDDKKPIGHDFSGDYGSAVLLKYATFSMYNERMRTTQISDINQYDLFRRMNSFAWDVVHDNLDTPPMNAMNYVVDLTLNLFGKPLTLKDVMKGDRLFYDRGNMNYEILSLEKGNTPTSYIISERPVDLLGNYIGETTQTEVVINSNFELHAALGGVYSKSLKDGELVYSDASIFATTGYVNNVGQYYGEDYPSQSNTWQPLKHKMITALVNKSAIKVGAENINKTKTWSDSNSVLRYMTFNTKGSGIQMDADHIVVDSEHGGSTMTEFSQVISAVEANGYTHNIARGLYKDLGKVALSAIAEEEAAIKKFISSNFSEEGKSKIYEMVGTYIIKQLKNGGKDLGLAQNLVTRVKAEFAKRNKNHIDDEFKIPFSDPSIFGMALSGFTSAINSSAIKRKFPGVGAVMVPAYNMVQNFVLPDGTYSYDDVYRAASLANVSVGEYLQTIQATIESASPTTTDRLMPGDRVKVPMSEVDELAKAKGISVEAYIAMNNLASDGDFVTGDLDTYDSYQFFKSTFKTFYQDYTKPRNLKPQQVYWRDSSGKQHNIFDIPTVKYAFTKRKDGNITKEEELELQKAVTNSFNILEAGFMPLTLEQQTERATNMVTYDTAHGVATMYGQLVMPMEAGSLVNEPAEMVISKLYAEKFNLGPSDTLNDVLTQGAKFFISKHAKYHEPKTQNYQFCFTRGNGRHTYIVFEDSPMVKKLDVKKLDSESYVRDGDNLFRTNLEGRKLYRAGFYDENNSYHDLVKTYMSSDTTSSEEVLVVKNPDEVLSLYNSKEYDGILINKTASDAKEKIYETIEKGAESVIGFSELKLLSDQNPANLVGLVSMLESSNTAKIVDMAQKKYVSFQKSLEFTVARIPAQTMQSFMKMKVSQFSTTDKNVVYVSHIQTWLQGSDYDIDKAYIMGYDFDDNGVYAGWSPFFNYSSVEALKKSELLPTPNEKECVFSDNPTALDVTEYLSHLNETNFYTEEALDELVGLLSAVDDFEGDELIYDRNIIEENTANYVLERINEHNSYMQDYNKKGSKGDKIVPKNVLPSFRNAVSSKISNVIINLKNANSAYTPINMDAPKAAAQGSILGKEAARITYTTPSSKWLMTSQNMDGKAVIGITAVGEKIFFAASYYFNEGLRSGDPTWLNNMFFQRIYSKIQSTVSENGKPLTVSTMRNIMANVNFDNLEDKKAIFANLIENAVTKSLSQEQVSRILKEQLGLQPDQSLVISALLSAATDNAKELILSKINAGPNLAGVYLHLIMLGFNFDDIANLMISPTVQTINDLSKTNIFDDYHDNSSGIIDSVLKTLKTGPNMSKYLDRQSILTQLNTARNSGFQGTEKEWKVEISKRFTTNRNLQDVFFPETVSDYRFLEEFEFLQKKREDIDTETFAQFEKIKDDAKETTTLGKVFGLNQGMKTDIVGKLSFLNMLESALTDMEKKYDSGLNDENQFLLLVKEQKPYLEDNYVLSAYRTAKELGIVRQFDIRQFLDPTNLEYRKATIDYYNCLKSVWNIFDMIDKIPHFKALYKVLYMTDLVDTKISNKFAIIDKLRKSLRDKGVILTDAKLKGLSEYVDDVLISNWLNKENITLTLDKDMHYLTDTAQILPITTDSETFNLSTDEGRATFKLWFEQTLMQDLKAGLINGRNSPKLRINYFIQGLQMAKRTDNFSKDTVTYIKLPIDMMNIKTESDQANFSKYKDSFTQLKAYNIQGRPLTDWFFLYNLVTNKNNYGSDRMTTLFSSFLAGNPEPSIILKYEQFVASSDYSGVIDMDSFLITDAQIRMAPVIAKNQLYRATDDYVRVYNSETKRYDLMKKYGYDYSKELTYDEKGLKNYYNYFVIRTPEQSRKLKTLKITSNDSLEDLVKKLGNLMSRNTLNIIINCE